MQEREADLKFGVIEHFEWLKNMPAGLLDLASSGIEGPATISNLGISLDGLPLSNGNPYGYPPLKEWLANRFGTFPDHIALVPGASGANFAAISTLITGEDSVILESPVYQPFVSVVEAVIGRTPEFFERRPEEGYGLDPDAPFEGGRKPKLVIATNLHNPSGAWEPFETFVSLADRAARADGWLLVDEIFLPFLDSHEWKSAATLHDRIIATGSLTKVWGLSGLRLGWVIGPPAIIYKVQRLLDYISGVLPVFTEALAFKLLSEGHADRLSQAARERAQSNGVMVAKWLEEWGELQFNEPAGGIILMARRRDGTSFDPVCKRLLERYRVLTTPGRFFRDPAGIRIGFGNDSELVRTGLELLKQAYKEV